MANLISVERASIQRGTKVILDEVSLGIGEGDSIGVVGRNGSGKTTLLGVITGGTEVDSGRVTIARGTTIGAVSQSDSAADGATVRDLIFAGQRDFELHSDARIRGILAGLLGDLSASEVGGLDAPMATRSGGERRRIALAAMLARDPQVLVLDEPTNHLDVEGVAWLANYLNARANKSNALVVVTHDRWFLDSVATRTWEVVDGAVTGFDGGYAAYVLAKAERQRQEEVRSERRANLLRKELAWLRRGAPARTSKPKFRIEAANELIAAEPPPRDTVELTRFAVSRLGKDVIDLHDASVLADGRTIMNRVTWQLAPGERVGLVGANGSGKSTLLRVLDGDRSIDSGKRKVGATVRIGFLSQHVDELDDLGNDRVIEAIERVRSVTTVGGKEISASQLAKRLGFSGAAQQNRVKDLSGGERRRLQVLRILLDEPNVLLLDEPTNDLDIETLTALEDVLDAFAGTLVVVSHDRYLIERITDRQLALIGDGQLRDLPGGIEEYLRLRQAELGAAAPSGDAAASPEQPASASAAARTIRKTLARLEKQLDKVARDESALLERMADAATDPGLLAQLGQEHKDLIEQREELEAQWLEAADELEGS